jgi:hypothetical protein
LLDNRVQVRFAQCRVSRPLPVDHCEACGAGVLGAGALPVAIRFSGH